MLWAGWLVLEDFIQRHGGTQVSILGGGCFREVPYPLSYIKHFESLLIIILKLNLQDLNFVCIFVV
jgi:hypothetical protein